MFTTGNRFIDYLFIAITFLPLIPAALTLFSNFGKEPLPLIFIICLVNFVRDLPVHLQMLTQQDQNVINNVCYPIELLLFARLFLPVWTKPIRYSLTIFLVAFLSSLLTWFSVKGWENGNPGLEALKNTILLAIVLLSLPPLVRSKGLDIFRSPLLWMAGGTLFYLLILLLLEWVNPCCLLSPGPGGSPGLGSSLALPDAENSVFLSLAALVRYLLYTLAVWPGREDRPGSTDGL
jgi:hypothetical protein